MTDGSGFVCNLEFRVYSDSKLSAQFFLFYWKDVVVPLNNSGKLHLTRIYLSISIPLHFSNPSFCLILFQSLFIPPCNHTGFACNVREETKIVKIDEEEDTRKLRRERKKYNSQYYLRKLGIMGKTDLAPFLRCLFCLVCKGRILLSLKSNMICIFAY